MPLQKHGMAVRCFAGLMKFGNYLQQLPNRLVPPPFRLVQIGSAFWQSRALYVAVRLNIAEVLGDAVLDSDTVAERITANGDAVYRLLRMLAAIGVFTEVSPRYFKNNKLSAYLRPDHPNSIRAMILMHNSPEMSRPWFEHLEQAVRDGGTAFESLYGRPLYSYMDRHVEFDNLFAEAMDSIEALTGDSYATDFDWSAFERVIDLGGSKGCKSMTLLQHYPKLSALVFDRNKVVENAALYWRDKAGTDLLARVEFMAGDLLESVPQAKSDKDIYLFSAVLHGMDDTDCVTVLRHLAAASAGTGAKLAVMEIVVPKCNAGPAETGFDMQMFIASRGRERSLPEWLALFERGAWVLEQRIGIRSLGEILLLRQQSGGCRSE